jgi:hypothetical protein
VGLSQGFESVDGYKLWWDDSGTFQLRVTVASADITSYQESDVVLGKIYQWKISAYNVYGDGPLSQALTITPARIPDAPFGIVMVTSD